MHAFLQADSIAEVVKKRENACSSHGDVVYKVDYSKCKRVKPNYGMTRSTVGMPLVVETIGYYFRLAVDMEQPTKLAIKENG